MDRRGRRRGGLRGRGVVVTGRSDGASAGELLGRFLTWLAILAALVAVWTFAVGAAPLVGALLSVLAAGAISEAIARVRRRRSRER